MSTNDESLSNMIAEFCSQFLSDYNQVKPNLQMLHPDWSDLDLAANLMEFGRGQFSGIDKPREEDLMFIKKYVDSLTFNDNDIPFFVAYSGGCIMGLVLRAELSPEQFIPALELSSFFADKHFGSSK